MPSTPPSVLPADDEGAIARAARILRVGGLVALPTDTVYGLAACLDRPLALRRIFAVKGRAESKPLPVLLAERSGLSLVAEAPSDAIARLVARFWPGPLTLVLPARPGLPPEVLGPGETVGVRVPDHPVARTLIEAVGGALAVTSANRSDSPPATTASEVVAQLDDAVDLVLDGGPSSGGLASTVIECIGDHLRILRPGPISFETLTSAGHERGEAR